MPAEPLVLEWRPSLATVERAIRARRRATRVAWLEWISGLLVVALFLPSALQGDVRAWPLVILAVLWGTGLWGLGYRWLFYWRRHPDAFAHERQELSDEGILSIQAGVTQRLAWAHWRAFLNFTGGLMLMTSAKGNAAFLVLPRAGVPAGAWFEVEQLVGSHVTPHPHTRKAKASDR